MSEKKRRATWAIATIMMLCLAGCGQQVVEETAVSSVAPANSSTTQYQAPALALSPYHAEQAQGAQGVLIDTSSSAEGYVAVSATSEKRLKFQVIFGDSNYNYDLPADGTPTAYVLQSGSGSYTFRVMANTADTKYASVYSCTEQVTLADERAPFVRPSQMVAYDADSACTAKAAELAVGAADDAAVLKNIYTYISDNVSYDFDKAATVQAGYLPDPDTTLTTGKGICFDYAALAAAMLRSQGIPTKLVTGYVAPDDLYHAWNTVWLQNEGWITVEMKAPANAWERIDLTFAAGGQAGDGTSYTDRYIY